MNDRKRILVVDDDPTHLFCAKEMLEAAGHEVVLHGRAFGATERVMRDKPDLVLLDVNMPALSGETLVMLLRSREQTRDTPVLLYSSNDEEALRRSAIRLGLGPDGFVAKGDPRALQRAVDRILSTPPGGAADRSAG